MLTVNRIVIAVLTAFFLLSASSEAAKKPIPALVQTSQYQTLANYVNTLEGKKTVPVSAETRARYQSSLASKLALASDRLESLASARKTRAINTNRSNQRNKTRQAQRSERASLNKARASLNKELAQERKDYQAAVRSIKAQYGPELKQLKKAAVKLKAALAKTRNPRRIAILNNKVEENKVLQQNLSQEQASEIAFERRKFKRSANVVRSSHQTRVEQIEKRADRAVAKIRSASRESLNTKLSLLSDKKQSERSLIASQNARGEVAIDEMPSVLA